MTRATLVYGGLIALLFVSVVVSTGLGSVAIPLPVVAAVLLGQEADDVPQDLHRTAYEAIVWHLRLPRIMLAALVGGALSLAGAVLQGLFRNPMADPGIIGVSSGGALGAVIAVMTGFAATAIWSLPLLAFIGAVGVTWTIYLLSTQGGRTPLATLLLAGLAVTAFVTAVMSLLLTLAQDIFAFREVLFWLLGGLDGRGWPHVALVAGPILLGGMILLLFSNELNIVAATGETGAKSLGVDTQQIKRYVLICTALITGAAVSVSGIVGFVGLIVPHISRLLVGPNHRDLLPASFLGGANFLIWADLVARALVPSQDLRLGVVTALLGAPFFIYLLQRHRVRTEIL